MLSLSFLEDQVPDPTDSTKPPTRIVRASWSGDSTTGAVEFDFLAFKGLFSLTSRLTEISEKNSVPSPLYTIGTLEGQELKDIFDDGYSGVSREVLQAFTRILEGKGMDIASLINKDKDRRLIITSDQHYVLSSPWEVFREFSDRSAKPLGIVRQVSQIGNGPERCLGNNSLFLLSHGYLDGPSEMHFVADDFEKEVSSSLLASFLSSRADGPESRLFTVFRYLNRNSIRSVNLDHYSHLHLISHGNPAGEIGFEKVDGQWRIDWVSQSEFNDYLKNARRELVFLSCCYSGQGTSTRPSLAFDLVKNGISKNVIAFAGGMGSQKSLPDFVTAFYKHYMRTLDVEGAYQEGIETLIATKSNYTHRPVLYTSRIA